MLHVLNVEDIKDAYSSGVYLIQKQEKDDDWVEHVFILGRYKWHIHAGSWSLVNCWWEGKTLPYIGCS